MGLIRKGQSPVQDGFRKLKGNTHGESHAFRGTVLGVFTNAYCCFLHHHQGTGQSYQHPKSTRPHATPDLLRPYSRTSSNLSQKCHGTRLPESATFRPGRRFCDSPLLSGSRVWSFSALTSLPRYEPTRVCLSTHRLDTEMVSSVGQL